MSLLNVEKIIELRRQKGWDQKDLAKAANITKPVISRLERNLQQDFKLSVVVSIADALGVSVDDLLLRPQATRYQLLRPELQAMITDLVDQPQEVQHYVTQLVEWYLSTLKTR